MLKCKDCKSKNVYKRMNSTILRDGKPIKTEKVYICLLCYMELIAD